MSDPQTTPTKRKPGERGPNRVTMDCKTSIMSVYHALGGAEGMLTWAKNHRTEYYQILAKILPKDFDITNKTVSVHIHLSENVSHQSLPTPETIDSVSEPRN
jgi:hypothetical protein